MSIEAVYICGPEWEDYLFTSLRSLLASGTTLDRIHILCIGEHPAYWSTLDPRITIENRAAVIPGFFHANKSHYLATLEAERLIYLDTDIMIRGSLDNLWQERPTWDVLARLASGYRDANWSEEAWTQMLYEAGGKEIVPYFNTGFIMFQNGSQKRMAETWLNLTRDNRRSGRVSALYSEQFAFALALSSAQLRWHAAGPSLIGYGWEREAPRDSLVFHQGSDGFLRTAVEIEQDLGLEDVMQPPFQLAGWANPIVRRRAWRRQLHRLRRLLKGEWTRHPAAAPAGNTSGLQP